MKDSQFEDFNTVLNYNSELWARFVSSSEQAIANMRHQTGQNNIEASQSLDLVRAINSYRAYPLEENLFEAFPELAEQKEYVDLLWKHFRSLNAEELSNLAIEMIHEISALQD